uniref:Solute carrier organic anion transporter family member n=1 Tax=Parastrongyloides trichosuri TaxID=131310 RepID=A0A0N4ZRF6_PARTI
MASGDNLTKVPVVIRNKNGAIQINAEIQDTHPLGSSKGNVVLISGCPGSHKDFKDIIGHLKKLGIRCIAINFPGMGHTPHHDFFTHTNNERLQYIKAILKNINATRNFVFVGHSRGSECALKLATLLAPCTVGTVLINPIPILPYYRLRNESWLYKIIGFFWKFHNTFQFICSKIILTFYNWYYSTNINDSNIVGNYYQCMSSINLRDQLPFIDKFNSQETKMLLAYSGKDEYIETNLSKDLVSRFELNSEMVIDGETPEDLTNFRLLTYYQNGMKKIGCFFKEGNHFLQKHKADFIASAILCMLDINTGRSGVFVTVYFVEAIAGFYITTNIVNIERQFQIPSKISGTMVSASDFGYIPSVIFVSYMGSKGNRAKWIGGGCMLIGLANLMIAYSHFLFPSENVNLTSQVIEFNMEKDLRRLNLKNLDIKDILKFIPPLIDNGKTINSFVNVSIVNQSVENYSFVYDKTIDESVLNEKTGEEKMIMTENIINSFSKCIDKNIKNNIYCDGFYSFLKKYNPVTPNQLSDFRQLVHSSYAFCDAPINNLRTITKEIKCKQNFSAIGPTILIFSGLFILGIGRTVPFSLGLPLMDDNVKKKNLPVYFAIMFLIRVLGPSLAFALGSKLNQYYYQSEIPPGMGVRDPMWIGRWWLGFVIIGIALLIPSIVMFFFPHSKNESDDGNEMELEKLNIKGETKKIENKPKLHLFDKHLNKEEQGPESIKEKIDDFKQAILTCFKMPVFISATLGRCIDVFAFKGFFIFMNKYLEIQYDIPQYLTNRYIGIIFVVGFAVGAILGSVVMKLGKLEGRKAAAWVGTCSAIAACLTFMNTMTGCESVITKLSEAGSLNNFNFTNECINSCVCESVPLYPVCDEFGKPFYSPCHAGCKPFYNSTGFLEIGRHVNGSDIVFEGCSCTFSESTRVSRDFCKNDECNLNLKYYFFNMGVGGFFGGLGVVPAVLICLRSVPSQHRSIALGFQGFVVSLFATLPSSPAWGALIDKFCRMWNTTCDGRGSCIFFDTHGLRFYLHTVYGCIRILSLVSDILVFIYAKNLKLSEGLDEAEIEEEENTEAVIAVTNDI